ncbi:MAG: hypothetical protein R3246_05340 [Acidimicrobiia bacterium]|nr:hypothetical protein [Acidimicrobiia bacterium]
MATTTTTQPTQPIEICGQGVVWEEANTYVAGCFAAPFMVTPQVEGWRATSTSLEWVELAWLDDGERQPSILALVLAEYLSATPSSALDAIVSVDGIEPLSRPRSEGAALVIDVETLPVQATSQNSSGSDMSRTCAESPRFNLIQHGPGYVLVEALSLGRPDGGGAWGLGACQRFRIWAIPLGGSTVTVAATVVDSERFDELIPLADALVDSISSAGGS